MPPTVQRASAAPAAPAPTAADPAAVTPAGTPRAAGPRSSGLGRAGCHTTTGRQSATVTVLSAFAPTAAPASDPAGPAAERAGSAPRGVAPDGRGATGARTTDRERLRSVRAARKLDVGVSVASVTAAATRASRLGRGLAAAPAGTEDNAWTLRAVCSSGDPDDLFVPGAEQHQAKQRCAACPVRAACLADALDNQVEYGVWGGMTERERRTVLRQNPQVRDWRAVLVAPRGVAAAGVRAG